VTGSVVNKDFPSRPRPRTLTKSLFFRDDRAARLKLTVTSLTINLSAPIYWWSPHVNIWVSYRCCSGLDIGLGLEVYETKSFISRPRPRPQYSRPRPEDCVLEAPRGQGLVLEDTSLVTGDVG